MPKQKLKTRKSVAKRYKVTGSGKILHKRTCHRHLLTGKSAKRKRQARRDKLVPTGDKSIIKRLLQI